MKNEPQTIGQPQTFLWSPTQVGRTVLYTGLILGFSGAALGGTILTSIQFWRSGQKRKIVLHTAVGVFLASFFIFFFLSATQTAFQGTWLKVFEFVTEFTLGFLVAVYFRKQNSSLMLTSNFAAKNSPAPIYKAILIVLCGIPLSLLLTACASFMLQVNGICNLPGPLNTAVSLFEFRGLKSGLIQESDFTPSCEWNWETSSTFTSSAQNQQSIEKPFYLSVEHKLDGRVSNQTIRIQHEIYRSQTKLVQNRVQLSAKAEPSFQIQLPNAGKYSFGACNIIEATNGSRCTIKVQYDYLISEFIIRSYEISDQQRLEQIAKILVIQTNNSLEKLDHP